jgi:hypothetical protein
MSIVAGEGIKPPYGLATRLLRPYCKKQVIERLFNYKRKSEA